MRVPRTERFDDERDRYGLRFCCEDCGHFDAARERCRHDWPTDAHRRARYDEAQPEIVFCKEFELC
jgi:hypothetical protein